MWFTAKLNFAPESILLEVQRVLVKKGPGHLNFLGFRLRAGGAAFQREGHLLGRKTTDFRSGGVNSDEAPGHPARSEVQSAGHAERTQRPPKVLPYWPKTGQFGHQKE